MTSRAQLHTAALAQEVAEQVEVGPKRGRAVAGAVAVLTGALAERGTTW